MEVNNKTAPVTGQQDQNTISLDLMNRMKLHGMAEAFRESLAGTTPQSMTADTFLSMLLAREWDYRSQAAIARNVSPPLILCIRHRTFSLPVLQERGKAIWPVPSATKHAKGDSGPSMPMPRNCSVR